MTIETTTGTVRTNPRSLDQDKTEVQVAEGGSLTEAGIGLGAVVLSILALIGLLPPVLTSIAAIAVGAGLLIGGSSLAGRVAKAVEWHPHSHPGQGLLGGMAFEAACGLAGIVLGILALIGVDRVTLLAISTIVFGVAMLAASGAVSQFNDFLERRVSAASGEYRQATTLSAGSEVFIGIAGIVLGIIALAGVTDTMAVLTVAMLIFGAGLVLGGSGLFIRILGAWSH
jgi:hypothetical protein